MAYTNVFLQPQLIKTMGRSDGKSVRKRSEYREVNSSKDSFVEAASKFTLLDESIINALWEAEVSNGKYSKSLSDSELANEIASMLKEKLTPLYEAVVGGSGTLAHQVDGVPDDILSK